MKNRRARRICFANQKGGVGKSVSCVNTASVLSSDGKRVLVVDMDPQANATDALLGTSRPVGGTLFDVFDGRACMEEIIVSTKWADIAPSSLDLTMAERTFVRPGRESMLRKAIDSVGYAYDFVLIDTPPFFGWCTENAFTASDHVVIPVSPERWSNTAIENLMCEVQIIKENTNPSLEVAGVLMTIVDMRMNNTRLNMELCRIITDNLGIDLFDSLICASSKVKDSLSSSGNLIYDHPLSKPAICYREFSHELLAKVA